jgi:hypothetical protein
MLELYFTALSYHIDGRGYWEDGKHHHYNERNPGIILAYDDYLAGGYKNSFGDLSVLVAKKCDWQKDNLHYGFIAGGVIGYDEYFPAAAGVTPFAAPYVSYDFNGIKPTVLLLGSAVTLSVGFEF